MNEHSFVRSLRRRIPSSIYVWKISDRFTAGVPDLWLSGPKGDLWIEAKYLPRTPKRRFTSPLTMLQRRWLEARAAEGRHVAVIVGCPAGVLIQTNGEWAREVKEPKWITIKEAIEWLATTLQ